MDDDASYATMQLGDLRAACAERVELEGVWHRSECGNVFHHQRGGMMLSQVDGGWEVVRGSSTNAKGARLAIAYTTALHPTTVFFFEWLAYECDAARRWRPLELTFAHVALRGATSPVHPVTLDRLGLDFFVRHRQTSVVWFVDPHTGEVQHSGAKACREHGPGKRYCSLCGRSFSANNFVTQHMRNIHPYHRVSPTEADDIVDLISLDYVIQELT